MLNTPKIAAFLLASFASPLLLAAQPNINEMQGCQGVIDFVEHKVDGAADLYDDQDLATVKKD
jgi:hypothetical protein